MDTRINHPKPADKSKKETRKKRKEKIAFVQLKPIPTALSVTMTYSRHNIQKYVMPLIEREQNFMHNSTVTSIKS